MALMAKFTRCERAIYKNSFKTEERQTSLFYCWTNVDVVFDILKDKLYLTFDNGCDVTAYFMLSRVKKRCYQTVAEFFKDIMSIIRVRKKFIHTKHVAISMLTAFLGH